MVINFNTSFQSNNPNSSPRDRTHGIAGTISLLDIFGFECFAVNRFEQLCINFANEKLQQKFTEDVFKTVQTEYAKEGLIWEHITFQDNADVLDLIEGKKGLIHHLNEECLLPKGTDASFLNKVKQSNSTAPAFSSSQLNREIFTIQHYAGKVTYTIIGFMECNKDTLPEDMRALMASSSNPLLHRIFSDTNYFGAGARNADELLSADKDTTAHFLLLREGRHDNENGHQSPRLPHLDSGDVHENHPSNNGKLGAPRRRNSFMMAETVTTKFKTQLHNLMIMISATEVQYVRCIKPNPNKSKSEFSRPMVVEQLRSAGMVEAIRIARSAYPNRLTYTEFLNRFRCLRSRAWYELRKDEILNSDEFAAMPLSPNVVRTRGVAFADEAAPSFSLDDDDQSLSPGETRSRSNSGDVSVEATMVRRRRSSTGRPGDESKRAVITLHANIAKELIITAVKDDADIHHSYIKEYKPEDFMKLFQFGISKIYFSGELSDQLESLRNAALVKYAVTLQKQFRSHLSRKKFNNVRANCVRIQKNVRRYFAEKKFFFVRVCIIHIQSVIRMRHARVKVQKKREFRAATRIQSRFRRNVLFTRFQRLRSASTVMCALVKMFIHRRRYIVLRDHDRKMKDLYARLAMFEEEIIVSGERASHLEATIAELNEKAELAETEFNEKLQLVENKFSNDVAVLVSDLSSAQATIIDLTTQVDTAERRIVELEATLAEVNGKVAEESTLRTDLQAQLASTVSELASKEEQGNSARQILSEEFMSKESVLNTRIHDLEVEVSHMSGELVASRETVASLTCQKANLEEEIAILKKDIIGLNMKANTSGAEEASKLSALETELTFLKDEIVKLNGQLADESSRHTASAVEAESSKLANSTRLLELSQQLQSEKDASADYGLKVAALEHNNNLLDETNRAAIAEIGSLSSHLHEEKIRREHVEAELKSVLESASVLAGVVAAADAAEASKAMNSDSSNERELLLSRIAELETLLEASNSGNTDVNRDGDDDIEDDANVVAFSTDDIEAVLESKKSITPQNTHHSIERMTSMSGDNVQVIEDLKVRNVELASLLEHSIDEKELLAAQLRLVTEKLATPNKYDGTEHTVGVGISNIENQTLQLLLNTKESEITQLKQSMQQQQIEFQQLQYQYAAVTRNGVDMLTLVPSTPNVAAKSVNGVVNVTGHDGDAEARQLTTPTASKGNRRTSTGSKAFSFAPEILPIEGSVANMICGKLVAQLFLSSKSGAVMEKTAVVLRRQDSAALASRTQSGNVTSLANSLLDANSALASSPDVVLFECELTGTDNLVKRLRFKGSELRSVRRGKGKTMAIGQLDKLCLHIIIESKGELNLSLPSEQERDAAIKFFKVGMMSASATESQTSGSVAATVRVHP
jgi:myosin heavy subunit/DNA-binding Xre family transcriptional regulator